MRSCPSLDLPPDLLPRRVGVKGVHEGIWGSCTTEVKPRIGGVSIDSLIEQRLCTGDDFSIKKYITHEQLASISGGTEFI